MTNTYKGLDRQSVEQVLARNVRQYLLATGWTRESTLPERVASEIAVFRRQVDGELQEVVVPMKPEQAEYYYRRMAEAVSDIAEYENRLTRDVLDDLSTGPADVVRFHVDDPSVADGTILIEDGLNLFGGAKKALLAAACGVVEPLPYYSQLRRGDSSEFIKSCRMSSESGSFIARVICPLDAVSSEPANGQIEFDEVMDGDEDIAVPFTRRVTMSLMGALNTLVTSTDRDAIGHLFEDPAANRISANLCDALLEMQPPGRLSTLTVGTHWASASQPQTPFPSEIALKNEHFAVVEQLANRLRPQRQPEDSSFIGTVDELSGSPGADGRPSGRVTLRLQDDSSLLTARVDLDAEDYARAAKAHMANQHIKIWGTLRRRARIHKLTRYDRLEVLESSPE